MVQFNQAFCHVKYLHKSKKNLCKKWNSISVKLFISNWQLHCLLHYCKCTQNNECSLTKAMKFVPSWYFVHQNILGFTDIRLKVEKLICEDIMKKISSEVRALTFSYKLFEGIFASSKCKMLFSLIFTKETFFITFRLISSFQVSGATYCPPFFPRIHNLVLQHFNIRNRGLNLLKLLGAYLGA